MSRPPPAPGRADLSTRPRPSLPARLAGAPFLWAALLGVLFGLPILRSVTRRLGASPPILRRLPSFTLTDQLGQPFGARQLRGKVWIADFIFTACQDPCPRLTAEMAEVARRAGALGPDFHLVSFSVDPAHDSPDALRTYAARYGANPLDWSFLTGSSAAVAAMVTGGFRLANGGGRSNAADDQELRRIVHRERFILVDRQMRLRGDFPATAAGIDVLLAAAGRVANGG